MYTHSPDPSKQYAILRKIRGSRDQTIPGYLAPQEQIPWVRGWRLPQLTRPCILSCRNANNMLPQVKNSNDHAILLTTKQ